MLCVCSSECRSVLSALNTLIFFVFMLLDLEICILIIILKTAEIIVRKKLGARTHVILHLIFIKMQVSLLYLYLLQLYINIPQSALF